jgi:hypothetical protein
MFLFIISVIDHVTVIVGADLSSIFSSIFIFSLFEISGLSIFSFVIHVPHKLFFSCKKSPVFQKTLEAIKKSIIDVNIFIFVLFIFTLVIITTRFYHIFFYKTNIYIKNF